MDAQRAQEVRLIIREEMSLAMEALAEAGRDGEDTVHSAAGVYFEGNYQRACDAADERRSEDAANPFTKTAPADVDENVKAYVEAAVTDALKHLRDHAYLTGTELDLRIGDRLDSVITDRLTAERD